jgi:hypothetical protein
MKKTEPFMPDIDINDITEYRYYLHTILDLHSFEDDLPILLTIGSKCIFRHENKDMMFEVTEYDLGWNDDYDEHYIKVICFEVENDIDIKSIIRDARLKNLGI